MGQLRASAQNFVRLVILVAIVLLVLEWPGTTWPSNEALITLVFFGLAGTLADVWGFSLHYKRLVTMTLSTAINYATMILFGPFVSSVTGIVASVISDIKVGRAWYKILFNCSSTVISVGASAFVYYTLSDGSPLPLASLQNAVAVVLSGLVYLAVNTSTVSIVIGLAEGYSPVDIWRGSYRGLYFQLITLVPLGTLIVIVYHQTVWGLILLLFPIWLTHYSFEAYCQLQTASQKTMETLARSIDRRDPYTYRHSERVAQICEQIAKRLKLDEPDTEALIAAARVHDLGKIGIPSSILLKPGKLDPDERRQMEEHPRIGAEIIGGLPTYSHVRDLVAYHQERWDGKGYPYGLKGEELPLGARILAVADAYEAMTSDRPYRKALSVEVAVEELRKHRGTQFDPMVVDAFLSLLEEEPAEIYMPATAAPVREKQPVG